MYSSSLRSRQRGVNLIELIIVIVILGVIAVGFSSIFTHSATQYVDASVRHQFSSSARLALERISREVRDALPNSVRVSSDGNCVEFIPVITGSTYLDIPLSSADTQFTAVTFIGNGHYIAVMPLNTSEVYGVGAGTYPGALAGFSSVSNAGANLVTVHLSHSKQFMRASAQKRFFLSSTPISFCVNAAGVLERFSSYGNLTIQGDSSSLGVGDRLAQFLIPGDASTPIFFYSSGSLERNGLLQIHFTLSDADSTIKLQHEVMLRNVP